LCYFNPANLYCKYFTKGRRLLWKEWKGMELGVRRGKGGAKRILIGRGEGGGGSITMIYTQSGRRKGEGIEAPRGWGEGGRTKEKT
jgi:hypothetical protein